MTFLDPGDFEEIPLGQNKLLCVPTESSRAKGVRENDREREREPALVCEGVVHHIVPSQCLSAQSSGL